MSSPSMIIRSLRATAFACGLAGCASPLVTYAPVEGQTVQYSQGVGVVTDTMPEAVVTLYPTFEYQAPDEVPTFTLMVTNTSSHSIDFDPATISSAVDEQACHVYSVEERITEIRKAANRRQVALAIAGGLAAGAAAYGASRQTTNYSGFGYVGSRPYFMSGTIQTYDPMAGIFAGMAVGAATGVGIQQIARAAGYQEQAAAGIFRRTTIAPGATAIGQLELRVPMGKFQVISFEVPVSGVSAHPRFERHVTQ